MKSPAELQQFPSPSGQRRRAAEEAVVVLEVLERISYPVFRAEFFFAYSERLLPLILFSAFTSTGIIRVPIWITNSTSAVLPEFQ